MKYLFTLLFTVCFLISVKGQDSTRPLSNTDLLINFRAFNDSLISPHKYDVLPTLPDSQFHNYDPLKREFNPYIAAGFLTTYIGIGVGVHIYQANAWWKDERTSFHFVQDWDYALWHDKIGHFYGATIISHILSLGLDASGFDSKAVPVYSAVGALLFQTYVEVEDGFAQKWGFSMGDFAFDALGSAWPLMQYYYPTLHNYQLKFSYSPEKLGKEGHIKGQNLIMIDDYEGQKFWLSFKVYNLLPQSISKYWPSFLALAVGTGLKNIDGSGGGTRDIYIALDINAEEIPLHGEFWDMLKRTLNYIHFPMPTLRVTNGVAFFGFML